ncbi:MAG: L-threonylcarbamoyladenylate synthase [Dehalococcoidia bacterium]
MMSGPSVDPALIQRAVEVLSAGALVAYPTDTVYGLAALPSDDTAVERLFAVKRRRPDQSTPLLIASPADLARIVDDVPDVARKLIGAFWPGGLTIVLRKAPSFHSRAVVGDTVGLRVPDHPVPRELVRLLGEPITGTSANIAGGPEPLTADDVRAQLGDSVDLVIDGGRCPGGSPSTVVDCTTDPPRLIREGAISREELVRAAGVRFE